MFHPFYTSGIRDFFTVNMISCDLGNWMDSVRTHIIGGYFYLLHFQKSLTIISIVLVGAAVLSSNKVAATSVTADQRKVFEGVIRDYLLKEPIIIRQAIDRLRAQEEAAKKTKAAAALKNNKDEIIQRSNSRIINKLYQLSIISTDTR